MPIDSCYCLFFDSWLDFTGDKLKTRDTISKPKHRTVDDNRRKQRFKWRTVGPISRNQESFMLISTTLMFVWCSISLWTLGYCQRQKCETEYSMYDNEAFYNSWKEADVRQSYTCLALAHIVTGSNFEMAIAALANVSWAGPAFSRQLSGRSWHSKKIENAYHDSALGDA